MQLKGYHSSIAVGESDAWKKQMITWNINPAPAAPAQTKWMRAASRAGVPTLLRLVYGSVAIDGVIKDEDFHGKLLILGSACCLA
jgi:hypothetical protein